MMTTCLGKSFLKTFHFDKEYMGNKSKRNDTEKFRYFLEKNYSFQDCIMIICPEEFFLKIFRPDIMVEHDDEET